MEARKAIWIVSEPRPEHVAAVAWLNDSSSADFYLIKVEAVRIGRSPLAPLLTSIVGPSAEAQEVARTKKEFAARYELRRQWWSQMVALPRAKLHSHITPGSYSWIGTSAGTRGLDLNYAVTQDQCGAKLYIDRGAGSESENKAIFDRIQQQKDAIESSFGHPLSWERLEGKRACRIRYTLPGGYRSPENDWGDIHVWLAEAMNRLQAALNPSLNRLRATLRSDSEV